jgi:hypothetical protein
MSARGTFVRERRYGEFLVRFSYVNANPGQIGSEHAPAMVLCRPEKYGNRNAIMIFDDAAHKYVNTGKHGGPSEYCVHQAAMFAEMLGLPGDRRTVFRICEAVLDSIPDLFAMPPYDDEPKLVGEVDADFGATRVNGNLYQ